jgi:hypothetical protein
LVFQSGTRVVVQEGCDPFGTNLKLTDQWGNTTVTPTALTVTLTSNPSGALGFYAGITCVTPAASVTFAANASVSSSFDFEGLEAGSPSVVASAGLDGGSATLVEDVRPNTRTGTCNIVGDAGSVICGYSLGQVNVGATLYTFQAEAPVPDPSYGNVACGEYSDYQILCVRDAGGPDLANTAGIRWQTLEHPAFSVQHLNTQCSGTGSWTLALPTAVNPAETFLLKTNAEGGPAETSWDFYAAELTGSNDVAFSSSAGSCPLGSLLDVDVVEVSGATVTRGTAGPMTSTTLTVAGLSLINVSTTALFYSYRTTIPNGDLAACDRMVQGEISDASSLLFSRGYGSSGTTCTGSTIDSISWELVDFGSVASVTSMDVALDAGMFLAGFPLAAPVDLTRAIAVSPGQGFGGQGTGSGSYDGGVSADMIAAFAFVDAGTYLQVNRVTAKSPAMWTVQIIQLN